MEFVCGHNGFGISSMPGSPDPRADHLLAALPATEWERWLLQLEPFEMPLGMVLYESGDTLSHVYFPTTAIVSLLYVMENGASAEIAVVGNEGVLGISLFIGGGSTPSRAVAQSAGQGFRLSAQSIKDDFSRAPILHLLLRYTQALITQMAQTAVCNRHHSLDQQLCRWLLLSLDRLEGDELLMTQELIAKMLGTSVDIARLTHRNADAAKSFPPWLCISIPRCVRRRTDLRSFGAHRAWNEPLAARFTALVAAVPGAVSQRIR